MFYGSVPVTYKEGQGFGGGNLAPFVPSAGDRVKASPGAPPIPNLRRGPINDWTDAAAIALCWRSILLPARRSGDSV